MPELGFSKVQCTAGLVSDGVHSVAFGIKCQLECSDAALLVGCVNASLGFSWGLMPQIWFLLEPILGKWNSMLMNLSSVASMPLLGFHLVFNAARLVPAAVQSRRVGFRSM